MVEISNGVDILGFQEKSFGLDRESQFGSVSLRRRRYIKRSGSRSLEAEKGRG